MRKLSNLATLMMALALAACGSDNTLTAGGGGGVPGGPAGPAVNGVNALASSPSLPSDSGQTVDISAIVTDINNVAMEGVTVVMSTDSGNLTVVNAVTDTSGVAMATLSAAGDPTNRPITVTANAGGVIDTVTVNVIGTALTVTGPSSMPQNDMATYTIVLSDAAGEGIAGETVDVTSDSGNTLASNSLTTDITGQAQVQVTATTPGPDNITATALGISAQQPLTVSDDSFALTAPAAGTEVLLNTVVPVDLTWTVAGVPQAAQTISFSATRGTLSSFTATTNASGVASVTISSTNAGPSVITASNSSGTSTSVQVEFVADVPATIEMQASPFTIGPNEQSAITAIVRDASNNLVKNAVVQFDLQDVTGGQLSVAQATTNSQGRAQTFYTSSTTTSANNGVRITGAVQSNPGINDFVDITVAQRELFISIGTGNTIFEPNSAQYRKEFVVQVSDSQGNGVEGVDVQAGILSNWYVKGTTVWNGVSWVRSPSTPPGGCADEDVNRNGVLDAGEDSNANGRIEAGNIATASAQNGSGGNFTTDSGGFGIVDVFYPQEFAFWVNVTLQATTSVQGTEFAEASVFLLPGSAEDFSDENVAPPGFDSPFGTGPSCADTL